MVIFAFLILITTVAEGHSPPTPEAKEIEACKGIFSKKCGGEFFQNIFLNPKDEIALTFDCCVELVTEKGYSCHERFVTGILEKSPFKGKEFIYVPKSIRLAYYCYFSMFYH
ncbi:hypothetical protein ACFE04_008168 [Oxalis oulophora]